MASHIEAIIPNALLEYAGTMSIPSNVRIAYPNVDFAPDENPYIWLNYLKNEPVQPRIRFGNEPIRMGFLQVSVFSREGDGIIHQSELVGIITDHFARGTKITKNGISVRLDREPDVRSDLQEKGWLQTPIYIPWVVYP